MKLRSLDAALACISLILPLYATAQSTGATPANGNKIAAPAQSSPSSSQPAAPSTNQPKAPLAPGVSSGIRQGMESERPGAKSPVVDPNTTERTAHCSEARSPSDNSPPCTVTVPPTVDSAPALGSDALPPN